MSTNKLTEKAGLQFNVNYFRKHVKEILKNQDHEKVKIKGSHVATAALVQKFMELIVQRLTNFVKVDKSDMKTITRDNLKKMIRDSVNHDLFSFFNPVVVFVFHQKYL